MTISQTLTPFPTPHPDRDDDTPTEFSDHVDTTLGHLNTHITELDIWTAQANDLAEAMNEEIYDRFRATSTTSRTISTGSLQFTLVEDHRAFWTGSLVRIVSNADPTVNYMEGTVTEYDDESDSLTVNVTVTGGSGAHADWNFALVGSVDTTLIDANTARISQNQNNLILEAFRRMIGDSQAGADAFQDGWIDTLQDESNIDLSNSSGSWYYDADNDYLMTLSGEVGVAFGTTQEFESGSSMYFSCCKVAADKFLIAYRDGSDKGKCVVGTVNDFQVSFGSPVEFESGITTDISCCYIEDNKVLIAYRDGTDSNKGKCIVVSISGTVPTPGTAVEFEAGNTQYISCCLVTTDRVLICFEDGGDADKGKCLVVSISGTTPTPDTANIAIFNNAATYFISCCEIDTNKALIAYRDDGASSYAHCVVVSISDTTPTADTAHELALNSLSIEHTASAKCDTNEAIVVYCKNTANYDVYAIHVSVSGTTPSKGTEKTLTLTGRYLSGCPLNTDKVMFINRSDISPYPGKCAVVTNSGGTLTEASITTFDSTIGNYTGTCQLGTDYAAIAYNGDSNGVSQVTRIATGEAEFVFDAYEAEGEPAKSKALFIMEDVDAATLNTDIKAWASLDDGANYEQITLEDVGDFEVDQHIIVGTETLTDRNDQTTKLKITTHNSKKIKIQAVANLLELQ